MTKPILKNCPFCGDEAYMRMSRYDSGTGEEIYKISCNNNNCYVEMESYYEDVLVESWNRRTDPPTTITE